ncbi:MAG: hypothetical protein DHS20C01_23970 [marine bacterium B5-7]|nr:MAG: hypothetical protein DHS20C01_23970 [marine bacterium B5-7]
MDTNHDVADGQIVDGHRGEFAVNSFIRMIDAKSSKGFHKYRQALNELAIVTAMQGQLE